MHSSLVLHPKLMLQKVQPLSVSDPLVERLLHDSLLCQPKLGHYATELCTKSLSSFVFLHPKLDLFLVSLPLMLEALLAQYTTAVDTFLTAAMLPAARA